MHGVKTAGVLRWMKSLPLFLEFEDFRVVHACWNERAIEALRRETHSGTLTDDQFISTADENNDLFDLVETTTKGPETPLPQGYAFTDKDGNVRRAVRVKWWQAHPTRWSDIAISVPDLSELPQTPPPVGASVGAYPPDAKPVFFGHYWLVGTPVVQSGNALCLDYSACKDGPLVSYRLSQPCAPLRT